MFRVLKRIVRWPCKQGLHSGMSIPGCGDSGHAKLPDALRGVTFTVIFGQIACPLKAMVEGFCEGVRIAPDHDAVLLLVAKSAPTAPVDQPPGLSIQRAPPKLFRLKHHLGVALDLVTVEQQHQMVMLNGAVILLSCPEIERIQLSAAVKPDEAGHKAAEPDIVAALAVALGKRHIQPSEVDLVVR